MQITYQRPTPLEHSIYIQGEFYKLLDGNRQFHDEEYEKAKKKLSAFENRGKNVKQKNDRNRNGKKGKSGGFKKSEDQQYKELILTLQSKKLLPCVVFAFSRNKVDNRGEKLAQVNLLNDKERFFVMEFANRAISRLNEIDRNLPQIKFVLALLRQGIGVHHSGILPVLKEIVEILFSKGLIKVLVATETFAMGLNMPTKTVVFCELKKFDGKDHRFLNPGEYTQMAGRAGRRGKDTEGSVIMFFKDIGKVPELRTLRLVMHSEARKLESKFRIRYNQICNVLKTEGMSMEELVSKSFLSNSTFTNFNQQNDSLSLQFDIEEMSDRIDTGELNPIMGYLDILKELQKMTEGFQQLNKKPTEGNFIEVKLKDSANLPGILINRGSKITSLVFDTDGTVNGLSNRLSPKLKWDIIDVELPDLITIYRGVLAKKYINTLKSRQYRDDFLNEVLGVLLKSRNDALASSQIFKEKSPLYPQRDQLTLQMMTHPCFNDPLRHEIFQKNQILLEYKLEKERIELEKENEKRQNTRESDARLEVLKRLNYVDRYNIVELKGRVLGILNNPFNLVIAEALFDGVFRNLRDEELASILVIFVTEEKANIDDKILDEVSPGIKPALSAIELILETVKNIEKELEIKSEMEEKLKYGLVQVVYLWAQGKPFIEICGITDIKEGNIVRGILRLYDLLTTLEEAAGIMGDEEMQNKAKRTAELIKRDIAFATSLYISI